MKKTVSYRKRKNSGEATVNVGHGNSGRTVLLIAALAPVWVEIIRLVKELLTQ